MSVEAVLSDYVLDSGLFREPLSALEMGLWASEFPGDLGALGEALLQELDKGCGAPAPTECVSVSSLESYTVIRSGRTSFGASESGIESGVGAFQRFSSSRVVGFASASSQLWSARQICNFADASGYQSRGW